jgi:hypothetical protein
MVMGKSFPTFSTANRLFEYACISNASIVHTLLSICTIMASQETQSTQGYFFVTDGDQSEFDWSNYGVHAPPADP